MNSRITLTPKPKDLWQPGMGSVLAYHAVKEVFYDWAYNDLAGLKYGVEGFAEAADYVNGVPVSSKESMTESVKDLHKYSLSHEETYYAEGRGGNSFVTNYVAPPVKYIAETGARVGQMTGLNELAGFSQGNYDEHGKPDFADRVRKPNTVSGWTSTVMNDYVAPFMKHTGLSDVTLWTIDNAVVPVSQATASAAGTFYGYWQAMEGRLYKAMGYQLVGEQTIDEGHKDDKKPVDHPDDFNATSSTLIGNSDGR